MPTLTNNLTTTAINNVVGAAAVPGVGKRFYFTVGGTWLPGETFTITIVEGASGFIYTLGAGDVTGVEPTALLTYKKKLYVVGGSRYYFSAIDLPTIFNDLNAIGNGFVTVSNNLATPEDLVALAPYQGKLATFGRHSTQIWSVATDPADYVLEQTLANTGTEAPLSVHGLGELDVLFLQDGGIRSLRVRDSSLNAYTVDIGSAIDFIVQEKLISCTAAQRAAACGVVDPATGLYWLFLKDTIYVLSYFPTAKVVAWAEWEPTYQTGNVHRVTNNYASAVVFKLGEVNNVANATQVTASVANGASANVKFASYIWAVNPTTSAVIATSAIDLAFRGQITFSAGGAFSFTNNQTAFTPQNFVVFNGRVYVRTADAMYTFGGAVNSTYDNTIGVAETSWLDAETPGVEKTTQGMDVTQEGTWYHFASMDYLTGQLTKVLSDQSASTYDGGRILFSSAGTHFKVRSQTDGTAQRAALSAILLHYRAGNQK